MSRSDIELGAYAALIAGALLAPALPALGQDTTAREWLARMGEALNTRSYEGEFLHLVNGQVEPMRILHRVSHGHITERLISLSGSGREVIRNDHGVYCYLPDHKKVLVQARDEHEALLGALPVASTELDDSYQVENIGRLPSTIGRPARVVAVTPKDRFRFGHRLWIDEASHIPVRTDLCDRDGRVLEQVLFTRLIVDKPLSEDSLKPGVDATGFSWVRQGPPPHVFETSAWRLARLPPGFHVSATAQELMMGGNRPVTHMVVTDGFASVSVFIADPDGKITEGQGQLGSSYAYSTVISGHQVTAVGEVPAATVEAIASGVEATGATPH
jgi:sigma-E factor negative regulatory protein RseB